MAEVLKLTFNPFQENTYIVYDRTGECVIFDPGCFSGQEQQMLIAAIGKHKLKPVRLINTHCHIDHVFGNQFVADTYGLPLEIHKGELPVLQAAPDSARMFGLPVPEGKLSPEPGAFIAEGDTIAFGETVLRAIFTPGHSPASLSFFCEAGRFLIAGDVLFFGSIGRTDLPGGDHGTLLRSITEQLLPLGDDVTVYPGHGPATNIGYEKQHNPFL
ncbi:MBL fold metallo-hydrolase [Phaeodactylibacter luteus]|uniref:MBL fold metallo-hydrolase n=1 Tax=Phaeodactylibacter luteus TaxID=1564516 RepID=A0A5C6RNR4_9BACT|nr:MBL fold metallo-hydrolase [Phaeodactylibacter luteus]TXB63270.1 MBL fold metallo-hydrolase [Phaeodactylibacter luteus]